MACAIPTPSSGDVPLPTSSISTKDLGVARPTGECRGIVGMHGLNTHRVSSRSLPSHWQTYSSSSPCCHHLKVARAGNRVSCTNIDLFLAKYAAFVTRLKLAYSAGTKHPHIPMTTSAPTCLRYVLFPTHVGAQHQGDNFSLCLAVVTVSRKSRT